MTDERPEGVTKSQCNYPCEYRGQCIPDKPKPVQSKQSYHPTYNKTGHCACCPKDLIEEKSIQLTSTHLPKTIPKTELGPYTPGEVADSTNQPPVITVPYGPGQYCPCDTSKPTNQPLTLAEKLLGKPKPIHTPRKKDQEICCPDKMDEDRPVGNQPCYMPQLSDQINKIPDSMGPIGPWATGRIDWGPLAGFTGTRPVVDKYTITSYSEGEWRKQVGNAVTSSHEEVTQAAALNFNSRQAMEQVRVMIDKNQHDTKDRINHRSREILRWKCELERAIAAASDEIDALEMERARLKRAGAVLTLPEMIVGECLDRRTSRLGPELVRDEVEEQLMREYSLFNEIRELFNRTLDSLNIQMTENRTAKQRLEYDWSDKKKAADIEAHNTTLDNRSNIILFKPGATRLMDEQSSPEHWEHFTQETIADAENTRQRSANLRSTLDAILVNAARDLRSQADRVETALTQKNKCVEELRDVLESKLKIVLQSMVDMEKLADDLQLLIRKLDSAMKVAQTRLDNRMQRNRLENCRDDSQMGLINEVKEISDQTSAVKAQLQQTNDALTSLIQRRGFLELQIMNLMKTLQIDRSRIGKLRSFYPSASALMGKG